jgi:uncharacterized protein (TIGR03492 family)
LSAVLLLSNGHGEDLSGAQLAVGLRERGLAVEALPLVGHGEAYRRAGVPVVAATRSYSTGGLGYTSLAGRLTELRQGQVVYLLGLLRQLWRRRQQLRLVVAVGDLVPLAAAWLVAGPRRPAVIYLVAYSSHYEGRLRLPWPCGPLLRSRRIQRIWSRDALTATDLSGQLGRPVHFLGNPFFDTVATPTPAATAGPQPAAQPPALGLLPGSRLPEALGNLERMLQMLSRLPQPLQHPGALRLQAALVGELDAEAVAAMARPHGWQLTPACGELPARLEREGLVVALRWGRFGAVLEESDLLVSMAGTAAEQAVGLGKPVLQLAGPGPQFTAGFAEAQRRLLGPGVHCAEGPVDAPETLEATARLAARLLARLRDPEEAAAWRRELRDIGRQRIGDPGGSERLVAAIMEVIRDHPRQHR